MKKYGKQGIRGLLLIAPVMLGCMVFYAIPFFMVVEWEGKVFSLDWRIIEVFWKILCFSLQQAIR